MLKRLNNWMYGIEQRIEKWKRTRTPEYRAGRKAHRDWLNRWQNPHAPGSFEFDLWHAGWMDAENRI